MLQHRLEINKVNIIILNFATENFRILQSVFIHMVSINYKLSYILYVYVIIDSNNCSDLNINNFATENFHILQSVLWLFIIFRNNLMLVFTPALDMCALLKEHFEIICKSNVYD